MLLQITHDGPVEVRELGTSRQGIVWMVQPENFPAVVEMINTYGGPARWSVTPL